MPYTKTQELPESLQRLLPLKAQVSLYLLFNKAYEMGLPEPRCWSYAWFHIKQMGWRKDKNTGMWKFKGIRFSKKYAD